jgi:multidrug transporter EmrE-like cation transporter
VIALALAGVFLPDFLTIIGYGTVDAYNGGMIVAIFALSWHVALTATKSRNRILCAFVGLLSAGWILDFLLETSFGVSVPYPYWGVIEIALLAMCGLLLFARAGRERSDCVAYYKTPTTLTDVLACLLGADLKQTCIRIDNRFYGVRKGVWKEINGFDVNKGYEVRFISREKAEKIRAYALKGASWKPWRSCILCI